TPAKGARRGGGRAGNSSIRAASVSTPSGRVGFLTPRGPAPSIPAQIHRFFGDLSPLESTPHPMARSPPPGGPPGLRTRAGPGTRGRRRAARPAGGGGGAPRGAGAGQAEAPRARGAPRHGAGPALRAGGRAGRPGLDPPPARDDPPRPSGEGRPPRGRRR